MGVVSIKAEVYMYVRGKKLEEYIARSAKPQRAVRAAQQAMAAKLHTERMLHWDRGDSRVFTETAGPDAFYGIDDTRGLWAAGAIMRIITGMKKGKSRPSKAYRSAAKTAIRKVEKRTRGR